MALRSPGKLLGYGTVSAAVADSGTITASGGTLTIDLLKTTETSYNYVNGTLAVMNGSSIVANLHFMGNSTASFVLVSDGIHGTSITFT